MRALYTCFCVAALLASCAYVRAADVSSADSPAARYCSHFKASSPVSSCSVDEATLTINITLPDQIAPLTGGTSLSEFGVMPDFIVEHACARIMERLDALKITFDADWRLFAKVIDTPPLSGELFCDLVTGRGYKPDEF